MAIFHPLSIQEDLLLHLKLPSKTWFRPEQVITICGERFRNFVGVYPVVMVDGRESAVDESSLTPSRLTFFGVKHDHPLEATPEQAMSGSPTFDDADVSEAPVLPNPRDAASQPTLSGASVARNPWFYVPQRYGEALRNMETPGEDTSNEHILSAFASFETNLRPRDVSTSGNTAAHGQNRLVLRAGREERLYIDSNVGGVVSTPGPTSSAFEGSRPRSRPARLRSRNVSDILSMRSSGASTPAMTIDDTDHESLSATDVGPSRSVTPRAPRRRVYHSFAPSSPSISRSSSDGEDSDLAPLRESLSQRLDRLQNIYSEIRVNRRNLENRVNAFSWMTPHAGDPRAMTPNQDDTQHGSSGQIHHLWSPQASLPPATRSRFDHTEPDMYGRPRPGLLSDRPRSMRFSGGDLGPSFVHRRHRSRAISYGSDNQVDMADRSGANTPSDIGMASRPETPFRLEDYSRSGTPSEMDSLSRARLLLQSRARSHRRSRHLASPIFSEALLGSLISGQEWLADREERSSSSHGPSGASAAAGFFLGETDAEPTYEELLALTEQIGPAMVKRASQEQLKSLVHTTFSRCDSKTEAAAGSSTCQANCTICLDEYEEAEEIVQLPACGHKWVSSSLDCTDHMQLPQHLHLALV